MSIETEVDPGRQLVHVTVSGTFTQTDLFEAIQGVVEHPEFSSGFRIRSDHRAVETPLTPVQARAMVDLIERYPALRGTRWAVIVGSLASYGMLRLASAHAERVPVHIEVFEDPAEADAWLDQSVG